MKISISTTMSSHYRIDTLTNSTKNESNLYVSIRYLLDEICKSLLLFFVFDLIEFIDDNNWTVT